MTRLVELTIDGKPASVPEGTTLRAACEAQGIRVPTLCWAENLAPASVCRVCVVEVEGARVLAPSCSRAAEPGMVVHTDSPRVRNARKLVLELLGSSVDMSQAEDFQAYARQYGAEPARFGAAASSVKAEPPKVDNPLFVRDYAKCMLCAKCVQACGTEAQNSFAISVAGRGSHARISTEFDTPLPDSACVFCGNCIGVCPTNALVFTREFELRRDGKWDEARQTVTDTVCSYCGVGCTLTLRVQDNAIVRVTSPEDNSVTRGNLCVKGRFGWGFVEG